MSGNSYALSEKQSIALVKLCVAFPAFMKRVGRHVDLDAVDDELDRFIIHMAQEVYKSSRSVSFEGVKTKMFLWVTKEHKNAPNLREAVARLDEVIETSVDVATQTPLFLMVIKKGHEDKGRDLAADSRNPVASVIEKLVQAERVGDDNDAVIDVFDIESEADLDDVERYTRESAVKLTSVGCHEIDSMLNGGYEAHSLWCALGDSGTGKSFFLANLIAETMTRGENVLVVTLELDAAVWRQRVLSNLYQLDKTQLTKAALLRQHAKLLPKCPRGLGKLRIVKMTSNVSTIHDIKVLIERCYNGTPPVQRFSLLAIDYLDIVAPPRSVLKGRQIKAHEEARFTYEESRRLCTPGDWDLVDNVWTVSQIKRRSSAHVKSGRITADDAADSSWKVRTCDGVIGILCGDEDKEDACRRYSLLKRRNAEEVFFETDQVATELRFGRLWTVPHRSL